MRDARAASTLPSSYGRPIRFGDDATRAAHERRCHAIRQAMAVQYQVAPSHVVFTATGERLTAGMEVTPEHFDGAQLAPSAIIDWLVSRGVVLESLSYSHDDGPAAA